MSESSKPKRLRIFAGPNGSGKTTIIKALPERVKLGVYVNADDIEKTLLKRGFLDFDEFKIKAKTEEIEEFIQRQSISIKKFTAVVLPKCFVITGNKLKIHGISLNSYIAADIAEFIRRKLLEKGTSFSFETVLSHPSKLELIKAARQKGYRIYLYYVATDSPEINIDRVRIRMEKQGHAVSPEVVRERYKRSLDLLLDMVKLTDRAYIFDNSGKYYEQLAEVTDGKLVEILERTASTPQWFIKYFYDKRKP